MKAGWISTGLIAVAMGIAPIHTIRMEHSSQRVTTGSSVSASHSSQRATPVPLHQTRAFSQSKDAASSFLKLPLDFEVNQGQAAAEFGFVAHGPSYSLGVSSKGLALLLRRNEAKSATAPASDPLPAPTRVRTSELDLNLIGAASNSTMTGLDPQGGRSSYFIGNDPARWHSSIPHFDRVKITSAYPGIDLVLYGTRQQLEYDFAISPGADPGRILLQPKGARRVRIDSGGNAILRTAAGSVELHRPVAYQERDGLRQPIECAFQIAGGGTIRFRVGGYDRTRPLIIDPVLEYAVGFGGLNANQAVGVAIDFQGNAYVTGNTCSVDFPSTAGNFDLLNTDPAAKDCQDAFVTKLDPTASTLIYSDYIGGSSAASSGAHIAVDSTGDAFVAGGTGATDFPTVANIGPTAPSACALAATGFNCPDAFVFKLSPDGSKLLFSSLLGGNEASGAFQVKLNPVTGDLVVLGETNSSTFLPAPTTLETTFAGGTCSSGTPCFNSFLVGLDPSTGALRYSTYFGGAGNDWSSGLAFDGSGNIYIAGSAQPPFSGSIGTATHTYAPGGGATAAGTNLFAAKLNLSANKLTPGYLTLVQGDADVGAGGISVDSGGNLYFAGTTSAMHLGVTTGAFQTTNKALANSDTNNCVWAAAVRPLLPNLCGTGLVGKLDPTGALSFLSYLGGSFQDEAEAVATDSSGNLWITGVTFSNDFPVSADKYNLQPGFSVPYLAEMSPDGTKLPFATIIGGSSGQSTDLVIDGSNSIYVAGFSTAPPLTPGVYPFNPLIFDAAFVQKWGEGAAPSITVTPASLNFPTTSLGASSVPMTATVQNTGTVAMQLGVQLIAEYPGQTPSDFPESTTCGTSLAAGASCTITASFAPGPPSSFCLSLQGCDATTRSAPVLISNNAPQGAQTLGLSGIAAIGPSFNVAPNPIVFAAQAAGTSSPALYVGVGSTGDSPLTMGNIALSGPNASDYQLMLTGVGGPDCVSAPVPAGSLCSLNVTFNPPANATGTRTATLTFTDNAGDSPQSAPVTGTVATANFLNISPLTLGPSYPVAFGTSSYAVLDIQNPSPANPVQVTGLTLAGPSMGDYSAAPSNCGTNGALPMTIPAGGTCYVDVTFKPAAGASGARPATLTVQTSPAASGLPTVSLAGDAVTNAQPGIQVQGFPNPMNFGGLQVGETSNSASVLINIYNNYPIPCAGGASTCGAPLIISSIAAGLSDYTIANAGTTSCTTFPNTMAVGDVCTIALVFKPAAPGSRNTTLTIQSNDPQGPVKLPLYGSGLSIPLGEILQSGLDFGNSAIGVASPPLTTTLLNAGQASLVISGVTVSPNFAISANSCTGSLAPQATCTLSVAFTPPSAGYFAGTLTVSDNGQLGSQQVVTLAGSGATGPQLRITPATLNFGNQAVNSLSPVQILTLASTGDTAITFPANAFRTSADFVMHGTTCGTTLAPGATCTISEQYAPVAVIGIPESGTLLITDNAKGNPQPVYMQGTATQSTATATTTTLTSSVNPSASGQSVTFTAKVAGPAGSTTVPTGSVTFIDATTTLGTSALNGSGQSAYSTSSLSAGSHAISAIYSGDSNYAGSTSTVLMQTVNGVTLAATTTTVTSSQNPSVAGQSVTFTAAVAGTSSNMTAPSGNVTFMDGTTSLGTGALNGNGIASFSTAALSVGSHSISAVYSGDTNFAGSSSTVLNQIVNAVMLPATTTTVTSSQNPAAVGQSVTFTAAVAAPSGNITVPTGNVTFMDGTSSLGMGMLNGTGQATFSTSSLSAGTHSITAVYAGDSNFTGSTSAVLTQTVGTPSITVSVSPSTVIVPAGQTGTTTVSVVPSFGFNQQVSFACSGLPAASTCTFTPPSVTPAGNGAVTTTLTIATDVATASLMKPAPSGTREPGETAQTFLAVVLLGLSGLVRTRRRWQGLLFMLILMAGIGMGIAGCGGGGNKGGGGSLTPTGTSTVTVNATFNGHSQAATFTLTVQ